MNILDAALKRAAADLDQLDATWALIGGFAVSARAEPRFTRDVDIAVAVSDDAEAEELVRGLLADGYRLIASLEHDETGRLATVRLASPVATDADVIVDLLFASSGIEQEVASGAEVVDLGEGLQLPIAATGHLIALKLLARDDDRRPQDYDDLTALAAVADDEDMAAVRGAITLIEARGFARGRDLAGALAELLAQ